MKKGQKVLLGTVALGGALIGSTMIDQNNVHAATTAPTTNHSKTTLANAESQVSQTSQAASQASQNVTSAQAHLSATQSAV